MSEASRIVGPLICGVLAIAHTGGSSAGENFRNLNFRGARTSSNAAWAGVAADYSLGSFQDTRSPDTVRAFGHVNEIPVSAEDSFFSRFATELGDRQVMLTDRELEVVWKDLSGLID